MGYCDYWNNTSTANIKYHNEEWGVPVHNDCRLFECLMLEVLQCGLNWQIIINKRTIFRRCFDNFDFNKIADYNEQDNERIMHTEGMVKSPHKIAAIIHNAQKFQNIRTEFGSFAAYLWAYTNNKTILYDKHSDGYIPVSNGLSVRISNDLKKRGFKYVGPTTIYSYLQACGIINDHDKNCPRYHYINAHFPTIRQPRDIEQQIHCFVNE
ncbi:MAG: DNA-3-methyladenine glycosylase I [Alphaproteobacteria bacterium]|nr:DNA-3-methyladenine glycosylase I [Alphaproteobacteria bacterium]